MAGAVDRKSLHLSKRVEQQVTIMVILVDTRYDYCEDMPCQNQGTCHNSTDGFICTCPPFYTGETCQKGVVYLHVLNFFF